MYKSPHAALNDLMAQFDMIPSGGKVLCAVSGGADSVYLLHRLCLLRGAMGFELAAAHYNHNLRGAESDRDERFVRAFVRDQCGTAHISGGPALPPVELVVGSGDVAVEAARRGLGVEETARAMRYAFLEETAAALGCDCIATAHTADDNAETLLLHLARGAGLHGLTGIPPVRGKLIRPLLTTSRATIEAYLRRNGVPHVEDSTNGDDAYSRNKIRHRVIPVLREINPLLTGGMADTIGYLRADDDYLQAIADRACASAVQREGAARTIPAACIGSQPGPIAVRMVRTLLAGLDAFQFSAAHLTAVAALCQSPDPSAAVDLPHGLTARRAYGTLILEPRRTRPAPPVIPLDPAAEQTAEVGHWRITVRPAIAPAHHPEDLNHVFLARDGLEPPLALRPRRTGDTITLPRRAGKSLKKLFIDAKVPRLDREILPVLADGRGPLFVPGFGPDSRHLAGPGAAALEVLAKKRD